MQMRPFRFCSMAASAAMAMVLAFPWAVPGAQAQEVYSIQKEMRVEPGGAFLGIQMEDVTAANMASYKLAGERGVIVLKVTKGSPAEAAGLQEKDVILEYAGMPVFSAQQMSRLVRETPAGRKVDLTISRDGKKVTLAATVGKRDRASMVSEGEPGITIFEEPEGRSFRFRVPHGEDLPEMPGMRPFGWEEAPRPRLGVTLQPLTEQMAEFLGVPGKKGVLVTSIVEGSPAAGKLKAGDVIVRADNASIEDPGDLTRVVRGQPEGGKLELKVVRDKKEILVVIELVGAEAKPKAKGYRL